MMSEKLLPIVPGCRAILLPSRNPLLNMIIGAEVFVCNEVITKFGQQWICTSPEISRVLPFFGRAIVSTHRLMRIDGGDFKAERDSYELPREKVDER
jgi:hypothetical protein